MTGGEIEVNSKVNKRNKTPFKFENLLQSNFIYLYIYELVYHSFWNTDVTDQPLERRLLHFSSHHASGAEPIGTPSVIFNLNKCLSFIEMKYF